MKKVFFLFLFSNCLFCLAQTKLDSLRKLLSTSHDDTTLSDIYIKLGSEYQNISPDSGILFYDKALNIYADFLKTKNKTLVSKAMNGIPRCNYNIALIYDTYGNYKKAMDLCLLSLKDFEKLKFNRGIVACYNEIAIIFSKQKYFDQALDYYIKSLMIAKENNMIKDESNCYNNIGLVYKNKNDYVKAIEYFNKSIVIDKELADKNGLASDYNNLGIAYFEQNNYIVALDYYLKSLNLFTETHDKKGISLSIGSIGGIYIDLKEYDKAIIEGEKSLAIAKELGALSLEKTSYEILYKAYEGRKEYYQSLKFLKLYQDISNKIFDSESASQLKELALYQTKKIENENKLQKVALANNEIKIRTEKIIIYISIGVLLIIMLFLTITLKQRKKLKVTLKNLQKTTTELIESYKKSFIADMVVGLAHDLKTPIGNALLSSDTICHESLEIAKLISDRNLTQLRLVGFNSKAYESGELVHTEMKRISEWIQAFLTISTDQVKNEARTLNLKEYLEICMKTVHYKLRMRNIKHSIIGNNSLSINTLPGFISQVVVNLINNAIEHGFENYNIPEKEIKLNIMEQNETVIIECFNNGRHIPQDVLPRIFDDYFTTKHGIKGMGLSSVKRIVEQGLRGTISCTSEINEGVKFLIKFPKF